MLNMYPTAVDSSTAEHNSQSSVPCWATPAVCVQSIVFWACLLSATVLTSSRILRMGSFRQCRVNE